MGSSHRADPRYLNSIDDVYPSLEGLFDAGEKVQELVEHPGWGHLMRLVEAEVATIDAELDSGREPLSRAEYAMKHGRRGGLLAVREVGRAILHRYELRMTQQKARHEGAAGAGPDRGTS